MPEAHLNVLKAGKFQDLNSGWSQCREVCLHDVVMCRRKLVRVSRMNLVGVKCNVNIEES